MCNLILELHYLLLGLFFRLRNSEAGHFGAFEDGLFVFFLAPTVDFWDGHNQLGFSHSFYILRLDFKLSRIERLPVTGSGGHVVHVLPVVLGYILFDIMMDREKSIVKNTRVDVGGSEVRTEARIGKIVGGELEVGRGLDCWLRVYAEI